MWNLRVENLDRWYLGQQTYMRIINPEDVANKTELPVPSNALFCGALADLQKYTLSLSLWHTHTDEKIMYTTVVRTKLRSLKKVFSLQVGVSFVVIYPSAYKFNLDSCFKHLTLNINFINMSLLRSFAISFAFFRPQTEQPKKSSLATISRQSKMHFTLLALLTAVIFALLWHFPANRRELFNLRQRWRARKCTCGIKKNILVGGLADFSSRHNVLFRHWQVLFWCYNIF